MHLDAILEHTGRPCPRVELEPENVEVGPIAMLSFQPEAHGWALDALLRTTRFMEPRPHVVWRILNCTAHPEITGRIEMQREQALAEARAKAKG